MSVRERMPGVLERLAEDDLQALERMLRGIETGPEVEAALRQASEGPVSLFDVYAGFGGAERGAPAGVSAGECVRSMERLEIGRALVRIDPDTMDVDALLSNDLLFEACEGGGTLIPCPVVLPAAGDDAPSEAEQVDLLVRRGAGAAMIRPGHDDWQFLPFVYDGLLRALAERRLPLYCLERYVSLGQVAELAGRYPELPIIVAGVAYRAQRTLVPLLTAYPNVHLSLGGAFTVHLGIEQMVERLGPEQLLFGTGFPASEPMMAVTHLVYAGISGAEKALIGAGNFERLLAGVIR